jgi:hypothetical protein
VKSYCNHDSPTLQQLAMLAPADQLLDRRRRARAIVAAPAATDLVRVVAPLCAAGVVDRVLIRLRLSRCRLRRLSWPRIVRRWWRLLLGGWRRLRLTLRLKLAIMALQNVGSGGRVRRSQCHDAHEHLRRSRNNNQNRRWNEQKRRKLAVTDSVLITIISSAQSPAVRGDVAHCTARIAGHAVVRRTCCCTRARWLRSACR